VNAFANPRLRRLQADYAQVRDTFSGHPHVRVEPSDGRIPPERYHVQFRLRGLYLNGDRPAYRDVHEVEISLPLNYPAERPYCVPLTPIFHPNIRDYFCIADYWAAGTTLVDVIVKLGDMIQWRIYNPASPLDTIASRWAVAQEGAGIFPVSKVDLGVGDITVVLKGKRESLVALNAAPAADDSVVLLRKDGTGRSMSDGAARGSNR
jgi:ubiquitin-protein ligase